MAATKAATTFTWASGSATATGITNAISTAAVYGATVIGTLVTSGSAPTVGAAIQVQESPDGTTWNSPPTSLYTAGLTASTTYTFKIVVDPNMQAVRINYTQQTTGTGTLTAQLATVTGV